MKGLKTNEGYWWNGIAILFLLAGLFNFSSCKKQWVCPGYRYGIVAIKGSDTIDNISLLGGPYTDYSEYNSSYFHAMKNYYLTNGYTVIIDSAYGGWNEIITDKAEVAALEQDGYKCIPK